MYTVQWIVFLPKVDLSLSEHHSRATIVLHAGEGRAQEGQAEELHRRRGNRDDIWRPDGHNATYPHGWARSTCLMQAKAEHERAERLAEELRRRRGNREDIRTQVEREAEAGVKLQMQQQDFNWHQKYQVIITRLPYCRLYYTAESTPCGLAYFGSGPTHTAPAML